MSGNKETPVRAALDAVKEKSGDTVALSSGYRAKLNSVPAPLIDSATSRIKDPKVPKVMDEAKGREVENPNHPDYVAGVEEANRLRGLASMDVMIIAGVQLVDEIPPDEEWLPNLKMLAKLGHLDLGEFDLEDEMEREFVFKKFVAVGQEDYQVIARKSGVLPEEVAAAEKSFPS